LEASSLEQLIASAIPGAQVDARDLNGGGDHFEVTVVSDRFEECSHVERHRMIYSALGDAMEGAIHALTISALTPAQYGAGLVDKIDTSK